MTQEMRPQEKETQSELHKKLQQEVGNQRCTLPIRLVNLISISTSPMKGQEILLEGAGKSADVLDGNIS